MYFPELSSLKSNEIGHINYQHPKRSASHFNQYIDRFSAIVIYIGLKAISLNSSLWKKYDNGENILFKSHDFADLQHSALIQDLYLIPEIKPLVERLVGCCHLEFGEVPSLKDFLSGNFKFDKSAIGKISITRSQYEIIDAINKGNLLEHIGEKIEVVGKISGKYAGSTYDGSPYVFLNFGSYPNQTFTLVVWHEGILSLTGDGLSPTSLVGKYVSVTGVLGSYGSKPQMIIDQPTQIQVLTSEAEANQRLKLKNPKAIPPPSQAIKSIVDLEADILNRIYKDRTGHLPSNQVPSSTPSIYKSPNSTYNAPNLAPKQTTSSKSNNNRGCIVGIVFAIIGAILMGIILNGSLWIIGAIGGGILGGCISNLLKL